MIKYGRSDDELRSESVASRNMEESTKHLSLFQKCEEASRWCTRTSDFLQHFARKHSLQCFGSSCKSHRASESLGFVSDFLTPLKQELSR